MVWGRGGQIKLRIRCKLSIPSTLNLTRGSRDMPLEKFNIKNYCSEIEFQSIFSNTWLNHTAVYTYFRSLPICRSPKLILEVLITIVILKCC